MYLLCLVYLLLECGDGIWTVFFCDCVMRVESGQMLFQGDADVEDWMVGVCFEHTRFAALLLLHMRVVFVAFTNQICVLKAIDT